MFGVLVNIFGDLEATAAIGTDGLEHCSGAGGPGDVLRVTGAIAALGGQIPELLPFVPAFEFAVEEAPSGLLLWTRLR